MNRARPPRPASRLLRKPGARAVTLAGALVAALTLGACASTPIDLDERGARPEPVVAAQVAGDASLARGTVLWGGTIIGTANLDSGSQLEVLAHPLDRTQRPQVALPSQGRFIVASDDYLEPLDYAEGRQVTVLGTLDGLDEASVGEARRELPVVRATDLHLWRGDGARGRTGLSFGIGIGSGGRTSGGVGIGIGN